MRVKPLLQNIYDRLGRRLLGIFLVLQNKCITKFIYCNYDSPN
jgi:hypothetical protein